MALGPETIWKPKRTPEEKADIIEHVIDGKLRLEPKGERAEYRPDDHVTFTLPATINTADHEVCGIVRDRYRAQGWREVCWTLGTVTLYADEKALRERDPKSI